MNDSTAATAHTTVWSRLTGTPSSAARSARSALARMAMPMLVQRSKKATPMQRERRHDQGDQVVGREHDAGRS